MKSNEALIKHVLLDYALIIPKRLEASSLELKGEDYQNLDAIKKNVLYNSNQGHSKHIIAKILIAAVITVSLLATLIACVKPLRNFFIKVFDDAINITGTHTNTNETKHDIEEVYLPLLINNTYDKAIEDCTKAGITIAWTINDDYVFFNQAIVDGTHISLDNEEYASYNFESLNEIPFFYTNVDGYYNIVWEQYGYLFTLNCPESLGWDFVEEAITSLEIVDVPIESVE